MDRGRRRDPQEAGTQTEDRSPGRTTHSALAALSTDLGPELGESRSAATVVAPAPHGAGADADDEPVASGGPERRCALEEEAVAGSGTKTVGGISACSVGEPATAGSAGVAGPTEPDDCGVDAGD